MRIVVIGGGFAGIAALQELSRQKFQDITLIDQRPYHLYTPLIYRSILSSRKEEHSLDTHPGYCFSFEEILPAQVKFVLATVVKVEKDKKTIYLSDGNVIFYDVLIITAGSKTSFFNIPGLPGSAYVVKWPEDISRINTELQILESKKDNKVNNFVVVGAGLTGMQVSGELCDWIELYSPKSTLTLLSSTNRLLPQCPESCHDIISNKFIHEYKVNLKLGEQVVQVNDSTVTTQLSEYPYDMLFWCAGIEAVDWLSTLGVEQDNRKRIYINDYCEVDTNIYAAGDLTAFKNNHKILSANAYTAIEAGKYIAQRISGKTQRAFQVPQTVFLLPLRSYWTLMDFHGYVFTGKFLYIVKELVLLKYILSIFPFWKGIKQFFKIL